MKQSRKILFLFFLLAFCLIFILMVKPVKADEFAMGVYPPILQIQATAPTIITKDFTLVNASKDAQDIHISFQQFTQAQTNNGVVSYIPTSQLPTPDQNIFSRVQVLDEGNPIWDLTLSPKQKRTLTLRIGLPKDEPGADYYFSILFASKSQVNQAVNGSHIAAGIAANILLSIGPKDETTGFLDSFTTPWFAQAGPIPFTVSVANTSRHFVSPTGYILIRNMFGQLIGKVDLLSTNILGNSTRFIPSKEDKTAGGHPVAIWNEKALFGAYRANVLVSLSDQGPILTHTIYFFIMPVNYIVTFFVLIVLLVIIIARVLVHMKRL